MGAWAFRTPAALVLQPNAAAAPRCPCPGASQASAQVSGSWFWREAWEAEAARGSPADRGTSEDPGGPAPPTGPFRISHEVAPGRHLPALAIKARLGICRLCPQDWLPGPSPNLNRPLHISGSGQGWEVNWVGTIRPHSTSRFLKPAGRAQRSVRVEEMGFVGKAPL